MMKAPSSPHAGASVPHPDASLPSSASTSSFGLPSIQEATGGKLVDLLDEPTMVACGVAGAPLI